MVEIEKTERIDVYYVSGNSPNRSVRVEVATATRTNKITRLIITGRELTALEVWSIIKLYENEKLPLPDF